MELDCLLEEDMELDSLLEVWNSCTLLSEVCSRFIRGDMGVSLKNESVVLSHSFSTYISMGMSD